MKYKSLKDYIGTLPLTMEMFPEKQWTDDKGRQWTSNIKTSLEKNPKDNKWYLFPTMMGGLDLPFIGAYEGALKGKHFGVYDSKKEGMKADKAIHEYFDSIKGYQQGGVIEPDATKVHNNIDNLILQAELDKLAQTGSMRVDRTPEYIGGVDPVVENVALSPIMTLKSLGSVGRKLLEKTGLRNPVSHYTTGQGTTNILKSGEIRGTSLYPGRSSKTKLRKFKEKNFGIGRPDDWSVSVTRDPMFTSRPHGSIGTDIRFILDRDELVKKGFPMKPIAVANYGKVSDSWNPKKLKISPDRISEIEHFYTGKYPKQMNPRFEFEERVRGNIPTENIKLIDILQLPLLESDLSDNMLRLLGQLSKAKRKGVPIIKSSLAENRLNKFPNPGIDDIYELLQTPTYKYDPFKR